MNQLHVHTSPDLGALAAAFVAHLDVGADPFARPLVLVPGPGVQRWLSQQAARRSASDGEGITAGWDVHGLASLERLLAGSDDDPWSPRRLVWAILAAVDEGAPGIAPLARHLAATDQRYANALRVARLFARYADHRPAVLTHWRDDPDAASACLGVDGWQVHLWVALTERIGAPDPTRARPALAAAIASGEHAIGWPQAHIFAPRQTTEAQRILLTALGERIPVHVWLPTIGPQDSDNPLALALGRRARAWQKAWESVAATATDHAPEHAARPSLLGALQASVHAGTPIPTRTADGSVSIHSSHGEARQVEVLREALTALFADDPSLEPRDVVIACPNPDALAPHLSAAFTAPIGTDAALAAHPATQLRVQVASTDATGANRLAALLRTLMSLNTQRATASDLIALASHPFVARRFSFDADDLARLEDLISAAEIRWGISREHRAWFGLEQITQNTWQVGVQRLVMGEAFSGDRLPHAGVVSPVDDVTSTDIRLIGALAELVSRVKRAIAVLGVRGTGQQWAQRLRALTTSMAEVPFEDGWQLSQLWAVLAAIEESADATTMLSPTDALALLDAHLADRTSRPAYGNGSLIVTALDALPRVPHRIVCLVGLDDRTFPRRSLGDGDDLLARAPEPGDPDPGADDRQALLDAILAATDHLVIVHQGQSSLTPEAQHPPAGLQDLIECLPREVVTDEPLQPFAPRLFTGKPRSFDRANLAAARALTQPRIAPPDRYAITHLHRTTPLTSVDVDRLAAFVQHPGAFLLRERADLRLGDDDAAPETLPLELDHLERWAITTRLLESLQAGHPRDSAERDQWLTGELPPRRLGAALLAPLAQTASDVHAAFLRAVGDAPPVTIALDLDIEGVRLSGRLRTHGGLLASAQAGSVSAKHLGAAWVRLLALTVHQGRRTDAILVGARGTHRLSAPPPDLAATLLADLIALAEAGTERVLPLPPRVAQFWAAQRHRGRDPRDDQNRLKQLWKWDHDATWASWFDTGDRQPWKLRREPGDPWGVPEEDTVLGALALRVWEPIRRAEL